MRLPTVGGRRGALTALALAAATVGLVLIVVAVLAQESAPQPPRAAGRIDGGSSASPPSPGNRAGTGSPTSSPAGPTGSPAAATGELPLPRSLPQRITIPAIAVSSPVVPIGLAPDGTLAVPQPGPHLNHAAWFENSPTPGQPGPSIIEGHVDSPSGPSVFFKLGQLQPGDRIFVLRKDGVEAMFTVNAVRNYPKSEFPTEVVYGGNTRTLGQPLLRLITCSDFDASLGTHTGNAVIFAHLTSTDPSPAG